MDLRSGPSSLVASAEYFMADHQSTPAPIHFAGGRTGVLLLHGFSGTLEDLRTLAERLHREGWTVRGEWLAGHGTREAELAGKTYGDWVLSLRRGLHALEPAVDRLVIVGESFGGNLALYAALLGRPIVGVVTMGTPVTFRRDLLIRTLLPLVKRLKPMRRKSWVRDEAAQRAKRGYVFLPLRAFAEVITFIDRHTKRELGGVHCPVLVVQAGADFETHPDSAHFIAEHVGTDDVEVMRVDGRVHHVLSSPAAPVVTDRIIGFIRRVTQTS